MPLFHTHIHRPRRIALPHDDRTFLKLDGRQLFAQRAKRAMRQASEIAELIKEILQSAHSRRKFERVFHLGRVGEQRQEIRAIHAHHLGCRAAAHRRRAHTALEQSGLSKFVPGAKRSQSDLVAVVGGFYHAQPAGEQYIEAIRLFALAENDIPKLEMLFAQQRQSHSLQKCFIG